MDRFKLEEDKFKDAIEVAIQNEIEELDEDSLKALMEENEKCAIPKAEKESGIYFHSIRREPPCKFLNNIARPPSEEDKCANATEGANQNDSEESDEDFPKAPKEENEKHGIPQSTPQDILYTSQLYSRIFGVYVLF